ncbi:MAG: hypothetical protein HYS12_07185 [Planctomycetes bacterium]|nr:hypothetical protein [Planctomycetota bacterium]
MPSRAVAVLSVLLAGSVSRAAEPVPLREDYQVLQPDQEDQGRCTVAVPQGAKAAARFRFAVTDGRRNVRSGVLDARELGGRGTRASGSDSATAYYLARRGRKV